jgi:hypothetical protein
MEVSMAKKLAHPELFRGIPYLDARLVGADHVDEKVVESSRSLREFIAAMQRHRPRWLLALFAVRGWVARLFGLTHEAPSDDRRGAPTFTVGERAAFFTVRAADERHHWVASADDGHLSADLGVVREELPSGRSRFHVLTVVHYRDWRGPLYFNLIRPFHHLVVAASVRAAA